MKEGNHTVTSVAEFVALLAETHQEHGWLFRGQADESWPLWPSLCRVVPIADTVRAAERVMLAEFKRFAEPYLRRLPATNWQWLSLAQHHGIPTRLLDWSSNPLAALFFAVAERSAADSVVWCYRHARPHEIAGIDPFEINEVHVLRPAHQSGRMSGQSGYFTAHPIPFRPFWAREDAGEQLIPIQVRNAHRPTIRAELDRLGITYATLFPDLDGVAKYIRWSHTVLEDERDTRAGFGNRVSLRYGVESSEADATREPPEGKTSPG